MDVKALAQATQTQQSTQVSQDSDNGTTGDMFAYLLKHSYGSNLSKHTLMNSQALIDMVGNAPTYTPPVQTAPAAPAPEQQQSSDATQQQSANTDTTTTQQAPTQTTASAETNTDTDTNAPQQSNANTAQVAQAPTRGRNSGAGNQTTTTTTTTQASTNNGDDETTEATAAVMAATVYVAPQQQTPIAAIEAVAAGKTNTGPTNAGAQQNTGPVAGPTAGPTGPQLAAAAQDDEPSDSTPAWTANFLNSAATTPTMAQQASSLSQITGSSGTASVSTQTTTGNTNAPTSTATLVPDAVTALPGFFSGSQQDTSTGGDDNGQSNNGQADDNSQLSAIDPTTESLAEDMQALTAISALLQNTASAVIGTQQAAGATVAATAATSQAAEAAMPNAPSQAPTAAPAANSSSFVSQLQEADEPEQTQAPKQIQLPSAIEQLKMQIEKGVAAGSSTIKVQLNPDNMGRVDVKLEVQNGTVKATITADRPETLALLKSDQQGMVQALQDAGLNADSSSLSFYMRGGEGQQRQFAQSGRQGRSQSNGAEGVDSISSLSSTSGASAASAASSALDISV
ncbi:MAG TPA: flagellar hook-length control protein FliK [Magnetospirillaceae bacterium]